MAVRGAAYGGSSVGLTHLGQFHSDAERGLGPRVASLSLGSSAYMHFRVLKKYRDDKSSGASQNILTLFLRHVRRVWRRLSEHRR